MNSEILKPERHLRNELYSLSLVAIAPIVIALLFPYYAIGWKPSSALDETLARRARSSCAFVNLTEEGEAIAVNATRSSMKTSSEGSLGRLRANLSMSEIPEEAGEIASIEDRSAARSPDIVKARILPRPSSIAAAPAAKIERDPAAAEGEGGAKKKSATFDLLATEREI